MKKNVLPVIVKLINSEFFGPRIGEGKLKIILSRDEIKEACELGILSRQEIEPSQCKSCQSLDIKLKKLRNEYRVKCDNCGKISTEKKTIHFDVSYQEIAKQIFVILNLKDVKLNDEDYYISGTFKWNEEPFSFLFLPVKLNQEQLITIFYGTFYCTLQKRENVLCIVNDSVFNDVLKLCSFASLGTLLYIVPISMLINSDILEWLNSSLEIRKLESKILNEIKNEKLRNIVVSVNMNPKFALTLLTHLRTLKKLKRGEFDWEILEILISTVFRQFFSTDITIGGSRNRGEDLPDNVFIVRSRVGEPTVLGLVDCKSSEKADFDRELTEKYLNYLIEANHIDFFKKLKKSLVFVVFDVKGKSVLSFYRRLENRLADNQYVVILPVDTLIMILEIYLSTIITGELRLRETEHTFEEVLTRVFDIEYLRILKRNYRQNNDDLLAYDKLFRLNRDDLLREIQKTLGASSSIEDLLKRYGS